MIESIKHLEPKDQSAILLVLTKLVQKHPNGMSKEAILASRESLPEELKDAFMNALEEYVFSTFMNALEEYVFSTGDQSLPNTNL